ncbi:type III secretion system stator protein SctL [Aquincola sp. S2]|uniref:Type 3 secretion system stator protein n=1 Tax=Pseudaquabacterium terrae TaxID=2732868 RepID=A0ABX2ELH0_9BURK|nr:type III secretion system stator protein SctL [Aquabacterium terrae]NRF69412.1 type III secretion system stator protein SctL [Aquabacterium terrae]
MGLAYLITSDRLQLLCERKVLKEAEYSALLDSARLIETARAEAARITTAASQQAAQARRDGYAAGLREAKAAHADRLLSVAADDHARLGRMREAMAHLVVRAMSQILADIDPARLYETALQRVQELLRAEAQAVVRVAPAGEPALRAAVARLREGAGWAINLSVHADASLPAGGCVLVTAAGTLDIGIESQLDVLARAMRGHET